MESVAVVPLLTEGRCVGALSLMSEQAEAWSGVSSVLLEEIAASMATALEHCVAYEEVGRLRDEQTAFLEINRAVARHLHREQLFATLAECLRDLLPCARFGIELPVANGKQRAHVLSSRNAKTAPAQIDELPSAGTACRWTEETRQWFIASSREELRERFPVTFAVMQRAGMQSVCAIPLLSDERSLGVLFFMAAREAAFHELRRDLLDQVGSAVAVALDHCLAYEEVRDLRDRLARENVYLQEEIRREHPFEELVGSSPTLGAALHKVDQVAPGNTSVLILGETGTGTELIARAIHNRSARRERRADIPQLVMLFLSRFSRSLGKQISAVAPETMQHLCAYEWPGNVRELQNVIERAVVLCEGPVLEIDPDLVPLSAATSRASERVARSGSAEAAPPNEPARVRAAAPDDIAPLEEMERRHIVAALDSAAGVIHGPKGAARILKLHPNTLRSRMEKLGITFKRTRHETYLVQSLRTVVKAQTGPRPRLQRLRNTVG